MNAWLLSALLCGPVSAAVVETGGAIAPAAPVSGSIGAAEGAGPALSPIALVPGAPLLAPSLNVGALFRVLPGQGSTGLSAGTKRLVASPLPPLPASAAAGAPGAPRQDAPAGPDAAAATGGLVPPSVVDRQAAPSAAAARSRDSGAEASSGGASAALDASGLSAEGAAALGRKTFDRSGDRSRLDDGSAAGAPGASALVAPSSARRDPLLAASAGGGAQGEAMRDAVASPIPAAAAPGAALAFFRVPGALLGPSRSAAGPAGAAPAAAPITFERLSLELGAGLVVKVRAAMGFAPASAAPARIDVEAKRAGEPSATRSAGAPVTSTEWLERRGLLESISASEAAASQQAASLSAIAPALAPMPELAAAASFRSAAAPAPLSEPKSPARAPSSAWWALAVLPALLVLLNEFL